MNKNKLATWGDYFICVAVFSQPALILMQYFMSSVGGIDIEDTTIYRVALTAGLMVLAMLICLKRVPTSFFITYAIVIGIVSLSYVVYPQNDEILTEKGLRFLLPVVVPSFICMLAVKNVGIVKESMVLVGWIAAVEALAFLAFFILGRFWVDKYSLSFSYACLFPMLVLYSQKNPISLIGSFLIFFEVLAFGSRGAALFFGGYMALDLLRQKGKMRLLVILGGAAIIFLMPYFMNYLDDIGVYSRTLAMATEGNVTESDGRMWIYSRAIQALLDNPIIGVGIFGDRVILGGYCHNIILELFLDFGFIIGLLLLFVVYRIGKQAFYITNGDTREIALILLFSGVLPLFLSGSYLQEPNFAIFLGYCLWVKDNRYYVRNYNLLQTN